MIDGSPSMIIWLLTIRIASIKTSSIHNQPCSLTPSKHIPRTLRMFACAAEKPIFSTTDVIFFLFTTVCKYALHVHKQHHATGLNPTNTRKIRSCALKCISSTMACKHMLCGSRDYYDILPYLYLYLRGGQHAVQRRGHNQSRPNAQPRDNRKVI